MDRMISILAVLLGSFVLANGQEIGTEICSCGPKTFEITLDFSLTCPPVNITLGDGVDATSCLISPFGEPDVESLVPIAVESIDILELGQSLRVTKQTNIGTRLLDGDTFTYTSVVADPDSITTVQEVPRALQLNIVGINADGNSIINVFIVTFTNDCGSYPVFQEGQSAGWAQFTGVSAGSPELCSAVPATESPTVTPVVPTPAPVVLTPSPVAPVVTPVVPTPTDSTPTDAPAELTEAPTEGTPEPTEAPTDETPEPTEAPTGSPTATPTSAPVPATIAPVPATIAPVPATIAPVPSTDSPIPAPTLAPVAPVEIPTDLPTLFFSMSMPMSMPDLARALLSEMDTRIYKEAEYEFGAFRGEEGDEEESESDLLRQFFVPEKDVGDRRYFRRAARKVDSRTKSGESPKRLRV